jgi:hypothetical protein
MINPYSLSNILKNDHLPSHRMKYVVENITKIAKITITIAFKSKIISIRREIKI